MSSLSTDTTATAIYEHGMLRLFSPLPRPERTRVGLMIRQSDAGDEMRRAEQALAG